MPLPPRPEGLSRLGSWLAGREAAIADIKPGNQARFYWNNPQRPQKTPLSVVYLHGFSAGPGESADAPERLARALAANAFIARFPGHGRRSVDAMCGIRATTWLESAREALDIGTQIGERCVLIGTSMGASLAFILAAQYPTEVAAVAAWSLGVRARQPQDLDALCATSGVVHDPHPRSDAQLSYWSASIHSDGYRALRSLFAEWMTPAIARKVNVPFLLAYYWASADSQDQTASVSAMIEIFAALGTPEPRKRALAFGHGTHVIGSPWRSAAAADVLEATIAFVRETLQTPDHE